MVLIIVVSHNVVSATEVREEHIMIFSFFDGCSNQYSYSHRRRSNGFRKIVITVIVLFFTIGFAYAHALKDNSDNVNIANYLPPIDKPVFYIQIFGNDFPVPTRFEFRPNPGLPGISAEFRSPSGYILKEQPMTGALNKDLLGSVFVGNYPDYISSLKKHPHSESDIVRSFKCYGLSVEVRKATTGVRAQVHQVSVLIHNGKEFIDIVGRSDVLPKKLLRLYGDLNNIDEVDVCRGW